MATVLSTLYPPLIDTFMPAFPNTQMAEANFSISPYNSSYDIHYLHVTLVDQRTNKNAFATDANVDTPAGTALINGVWIIPFNEILNGNINSFLDLNREANRYTLYIPPSLLKQNEVNERTFVVNSYYKLQIRFDKNNDPNLSLSAINSDYLSTKRAYFSEWSSVCLLKAIPEITVHFNNFTPELDDYLKQTNTSITNLPSDFVVPVREPQYIPGLIPFAGNLTFAGFDDAGLNKSANTEYYQRDIKTTSNSEYLMSYRIVVTNQKNVVLRDSGVQYPSRTEKTNNFYWLCDMTLTSKSSDEEESEEEKDTSITLSDDYTVTLTFTTNNQYTFSKSFKFTLVDSIVDNFHPNFYFLNKRMLPYYGQGYISETDNEVAKENKKVLVTSEDGMIELKITSTEPHLSPGYLFIKRASALDNFQNWQVLDCYFTSSGVFERTIIDNTLSSLTEYKYACQFLTIKGNWSKNIVYDSTIYPDFHDILISRGNRQLAIRYNAQVTSMTPVVSRVKIDTLGGRYPKFAENAKIHYKQFQLNGLIIAESDYNRKFLSELDFSKEMSAYDKHMNGKYMIRNDTVIESKQAYLDSADVTNHDVYPTDNWWWERKFREEAIEWLNDGEPKLYRSMTEGNLIIMIDGISLTPNPQLGRRIWNFSATLYEVGDGNSLEQLDALGIYDIANVHDENLTKLIEGESGDLPYEEHRHLGQSFSVTAKDVSQSTTKIVNIEKTNDRHAIIPIESNYLEIPNKKDKTWAETMTVGEKIQFWYEGMHRDFDPSSVRLRDVKIQFESLPQWYDLNALTPEGTNPYAIGLTMSVWNSTLGEWEEKTGRAYYTKNTEGEWVLTWEPIEGWNEPLWNKAGKSITDFINDWEEACGNLYKKIYLSEDAKTNKNIEETAYIGTAAAGTDYYKLKSKIDDKEFLLRTDVWNSLLQKKDTGWESPSSINNSTLLNGLYYTTKKKEDELNINSYVFLEKDLLEGDGNIVYKNKKNEEDIIYKDNVQPAQDSNYYRLLNNNNKEYYIGENEEEVQAFYPINKSYEYLKIDNNDPVKKYIVDNSLYRKIGTDCIIKNSFKNNRINNNISVGKKDLQQLDNLFSYKITFTSEKNNKNGINIFNNYYNSKITTNEENLQLNAPNELKSLLECCFEDQGNSANESIENPENPTDSFNTEIIINFTTEIENSTENDWWILTTDGNSGEIYKNIKWQEKFKYDQTQKIFILIESKYKKQNINIISKKLQEIFKYWVDEENRKLNNDNINNIINNHINNNDDNIIEIKVKPIFENKIPIEQKLYLSSVNNGNEYELSFSLKRGESIKIYNLPNKNVTWTVWDNSNNQLNENNNNPNTYIDTNSCENTFSGNYIMGQDKSGSTIKTIYVLQKEKNNEKIDLIRVIRSEKDIIFSNIPPLNSGEKYIIKRLNDNVERDTKKIENENNFIFVSSFDSVKTENDKLKIDISEDYILNTDLLEKDNNIYFWGEKEIQTQDSNGEWIWTSKPMFLPYTSKQEEEAKEKYIKYKSIYLSISDIQQYPYFYFDGNNYLKIQNYEEIYYIINDEDSNIILKQPNIHYLQIFTRDDILEADRTQTNPKPHYVKVSDWEDSEKWIEKCHYNYSLDPHIKLYGGQGSKWEWWDKNNIIQGKIYKNKNDKNSPVPMFEETTDDVDAYYKTIIKWEGYPTNNYYPLNKFFELKDENNKISSLRKYVFVANKNKYLPKDFIVTGDDVIASGPGNELIRVNLDTGQDWNITSSNDDKDGIIDAVKEFLEEAANEQQKIVSKNYGLGYKLRLILTSPYDPTVTLRRTIFVNDRGYYQVPSNLIVKDIGLFDGAQATIDYILEYELKYSDNSEPNSYEVAENVVGQISGEWDFSTSITPMIQSKYWAYDKDESGYTTTQQSVDYWRATSYDGVPYTRLIMKSTGLTESAEYVVSRSGVLNLETDYPTEGLIIAGKRMVQAPKDRQKFLDEWEYVLDESVFAHDGSEDEGMIHWWIVYPYEDEMPGLDWEDWMESDVLVKISLSENFEMRNIANWWYQINDVFPPEGQPEIQIINPQYNTIYAIVTPGGIEYKIYYLNQGWYPVEFLKNDDNETDYSFCNAKVPVSGTINYRASILKKLWINE